MHPVDDFLRDIDANWTPQSSKKIPLTVLGSTALFLLTDYNRGTKDSDVLETQEVAGVQTRLIELAGRETALHRRHGLYLDVVGSGLPFLPPNYLVHRRELGLTHFDIDVLDVTDVVVTKLKRFHGDDRADIEAMVDGGYVEHARLLQRVHDAIAWFRFDARSFLLPKFVENFNRVERDYFGVPETPIELPEDIA